MGELARIFQRAPIILRTVHNHPLCLSKEGGRTDIHISEGAAANALIVSAGERCSANICIIRHIGFPLFVLSIHSYSLQAAAEPTNFTSPSAILLRIRREPR